MLIGNCVAVHAVPLDGSTFGLKFLRLESSRAFAWVLLHPSPG
jgi:hypothetical protein